MRSVVVAGGVIVLVLIAAGLFLYSRTPAPAPSREGSAASGGQQAAPLPVALKPQAIGAAVPTGEHPQIAQVKPVDLDADGLMDVIACDMVRHQVVWMRQSPRGTFTETPLGDAIPAPAHAEPVDLDRDGDLDILVASLGVLFPSNAKIGAVVVLENDGRGRFANRVLME